MSRERSGCSLRIMIMLFLAAGLGLLVLYAMFWPSNFGGGVVDNILPQPTSTFKPGPTVIQAIQRQAKLQTVAMAIQNDTTVTREHGLFGACTESVTYLGYFNVTAGIDLSTITEESITVSNDGFPEQAEVTITLPPAELISNELDTATSRIISQDTPRWVPGCTHQIADMTVEAQNLLRTYAESAARDRGILQQAEQNAGDELKRLLESAGYQKVTIRYSTPIPLPTLAPPTPTPQS